MQRYFLSNQHFNDEYVMIDGDEARHISRVMRMREGDQVICCNGEGVCFVCRLEDVSPEKVRASLLKRIGHSAELPVHVSLAHGLPKGDKLELVIQKGTELGAGGIIPFEAERSVVKWDKKKEKKKLERWNKIAKEASEQSHRSLVPQVEPVHSFKELLNRFASYSYVIIAYEEDAKTDEKSQLRQTLELVKPGDRLLLVTGPEGGFSDREVQVMKEAGAISCAFGPRILRSETAPFYGLSAISYHLELSG
jgi:16S rRNA (uracil1498-N3)-methyltransferase